VVAEIKAIAVALTCQLQNLGKIKEKKRMARLKNIELFDLYVGKTFVKLYESFPLRCELDICEMTDKEFDEETLKTPKECDIYRDTVIWLSESGYINYDAQHEYGFRGVVLSAKGLELLKAIPESMQRKTGIGEKLSFIAKNGGDEALKQTVNAMLSMGLKMFGGVQ